MFKNILFFCLIAFAIAQPFEDVTGGLKKLEELCNKALREIEITSESVQNARENYNKIAMDRYSCILEEYQKMKNDINVTISNAVGQGLQKNKPVSSYECVSNAASETINKLNVIHSQIPKDFYQIRDKHLEKIYPLNFVLRGFNEFFGVFYEEKKAQIIKSQSPDVIKNVLQEADRKMKQTTAVVTQINENVKKSKFVFFEEFVDYVHKTENNMKKIYRDGNRKIFICVF